MTSLFLRLLSVFGAFCLLVQVAGAQPWSPRTASYDMAIALDTARHQVRARQTLVFTNPSEDTIRNMRFHMYYNAWKNNYTDFFTEDSRIPRTKPQAEVDACTWSWVKVTRATDPQGNDLTARLRYVQPDNDNTNDHTVLDVPLAVPVLPHQTYRLEMEWLSQIPPLMIRTGYARDYYFMVQWFPKLGVYEPAGSRFAKVGQWNCHQYHPATEYFGEYGVYDVRLTVPQGYVVGASGSLQSTTDNPDGTATHHYRAEDVVDFAWTAHPGFVAVTERWRDTDIRLLIRPEHLCNQERFLDAARHTLDFMADYIAPYPYPTLTIVSPPYFGLNSGAMEYPTLITAPTLSNLPAGIRTTETLVIHELIHQYFMQMIGTNEQEEPWMDEGLTSYFEAKILDQYYPGGTVDWPYMGVHIGSAELRRGRFFGAENTQVNPLSDFGWHFRHGSYAPIVYGKPAVWLRTLEGLVGEACMQRIFQTYFERWKFKHPCREDFIAVVNDVVVQVHGTRFGKDMNWFLHPAIYGTEVCDYAVGRIENKLLPPRVGYFDDSDDCLVADMASGEVFASKAILFRHGGFVVPVRVKVVFDNGDVAWEYWDGRARSHELAYTGARQIASVHIDPLNQNPLDKNLINNSYATQPDRTGIARYTVALLTWMQQVMVSMGGLV